MPISPTHRIVLTTNTIYHGFHYKLKIKLAKIKENEEQDNLSLKYLLWIDQEKDNERLCWMRLLKNIVEDEDQRRTSKMERKS